MICPYCGGTGCKLFMRPDKRFKFRCYNTGSDKCMQSPEGNCNHQVNCLTCKGRKEIEPAVIVECYPDKCLLPGAKQDCQNCKDARTRALTEDEMQNFKRIANQIGCDNDEWLIQRIKDGTAKINGCPVRLRPVRREDNI